MARLTVALAALAGARPCFGADDRLSHARSAILALASASCTNPKPAFCTNVNWDVPDARLALLQEKELELSVRIRAHASRAAPRRPSKLVRVALGSTLPCRPAPAAAPPARWAHRTPLLQMAIAQSTKRSNRRECLRCAHHGRAAILCQTRTAQTLA